MTRGSKITLGILTFLPVVLMFIYFLSIGLLLRHAILHQDESSHFPFLADFFWPVIVALVMGLLCFGLLIYYIIHVVNNKFIEGNEKLLWVLVFLFASIVGFPIYWYVRIWKGPEVITMSAT